MEIVFVAITRKPGAMLYSGTMDAVKAARSRANCRVRIITDASVDPAVCLPLAQYWAPAQAFVETVPSKLRSEWALYSICRWFVVREYARQHPAPQWPILALDNDVMVFRDMNVAMEPFTKAGCDFCAPVINARGTVAAYAVYNLTCLDAACEIAHEKAKSEKVYNDMWLWSDMLRSGKWNIGDLMPISKNSVFDSNIHEQQGCVMEPSITRQWGKETKKIVWANGYPYFINAATQQGVQANWIHCWGSYKPRTKELLAHAGI